jgi:hypothetical protein
MIRRLCVLAGAGAVLLAVAVPAAAHATVTHPATRTATPAVTIIPTGAVFTTCWADNTSYQWAWYDNPPVEMYGWWNGGGACNIATSDDTPANRIEWTDLDCDSGTPWCEMAEVSFNGLDWETTGQCLGWDEDAFAVVPQDCNGGLYQFWAWSNQGNPQTVQNAWIDVYTDGSPCPGGYAAVLGLVGNGYPVYPYCPQGGTGVYTGMQKWYVEQMVVTI